MGLFSFIKNTDINNEVKEYGATPGAVLLDVRTPSEFREGHIPGSRNVPLQMIDNVLDMVEDKNVPLYVYCYSGARSGQASVLLQRMGYTRVKNMGGISAYCGNVAV